MRSAELIEQNLSAASPPPAHRPPRRRQLLLSSLAQLYGKSSVHGLVMALRDCARTLAASDAIAVVHREDDMVHYVAEDAIAPLWEGERFPAEGCISGLAMLENRPILIPDIYADCRVPHEIYKATFVRSMAMFPIGLANPVWALGAYWVEPAAFDREAVTLLASLARSAAFAFERLAPQSRDGHPDGLRASDNATTMDQSFIPPPMSI